MKLMTTLQTQQAEIADLQARLARLEAAYYRH